MRIVTPTEIESVAWEGELILPPTMMSAGHPERPVVTLGRPAIWPAGEALENEVGQKWTPPLGDADYWLVRLACTLREPPGRPRIVEATETLYLRPQEGNGGETYAYRLFPERGSVETKIEFSVKLDPELKFEGGLEVKPGEIGATIEYRRVYPVIQSYDAGQDAPYWVFRSHAAHPLDGTQFVYAVVVTKPAASVARAFVSLTATVETRFARVRFGLPREAQARLDFTIPA